MSIKGEKGDKGDRGERGYSGRDGTDGRPGVNVRLLFTSYIINQCTFCYLITIMLFQHNLILQRILVSDVRKYSKCQTIIFMLLKQNILKEFKLRNLWSQSINQKEQVFKKY